MDAADVLAQLGGVATRGQLLAQVSRRDLDRAVASGSITHLARNRYALATLDRAVATAHAVSGVLCLSSAALHHGWAVKLPPPVPHVSFSKGRKLTDQQRRLVAVHRHELHPDDVVDGIVTGKETTLLQCFRVLPDDECLAIADSAARAGEIALLRRVGQVARGRGAARVRHFVGAARAEAANPFESVLRSIALQVPGLRVTPQRMIASAQGDVRPDLVDEELGLVLEADSFEWHGDRRALRRDARRYNLLVVDGWIVLRFAWEDVMFDPGYVRAVLIAAVDVARRRTKVPCPHCPAA